MKKYTKCLKIILKSLGIYPVTFARSSDAVEYGSKHFNFIYLHNFAIGCMIMLS